jgi:predicted aldo/keto reductase-like oxidoreductase
VTNSDRRFSRRKLLLDTSKTAVAAAVGVQAVAQAGESASTQPSAGKILNYHPKMKYRKLGKAGLMLSEVSLGGHWRRRDGGRVWSYFAQDEVPEDVAKNRTEVVSRAIDAGMNYVEAITAAECLAYGVALRGRREKMYVGADDHRLGPREFENCTVPGLTKNVEECLRRLQTDYLDLWRVQARMDGTNTDDHVKVMIETAGKLRQAGKIRHFGISSHNRDWLKHVIETYPEVEMVVFPVTARTKRAGQAVKRENVEEILGWDKEGNAITTSIFDSLRKHNVGLVTIKPFAGGQVFKTEKKFPVLGVGTKEENDLARLSLQCILTLFDEITCVVPGLTTVYEIDNAARVSYMRETAMSPAESEWLDRVTAEQMACLPREYQWLSDWEVI